MNGKIRCGMSGRAHVVPREAVVGKDLPRRRRADDGVRFRLAVVLDPERAQAHARAPGLGPAAAEEVRPTDRAERLRRPALGCVRGEKLPALEHADRISPRAAADGPVATGDALAELAVALRRALERLRDLEADTSAEAGTDERPA